MLTEENRDHRRLYPWLGVLAGLVLALLLGHATLATAVPIEFVDPDPFVGARYISTSLSYRHDVSDDGYTPSTDTVIDVRLTIHLVDDLSDRLVGPVSVSARFDYQAVDSEDLSVREGELLTLLKDFGESIAVRNSDGDEGFVPRSILDIEPFLESFSLSFDGFAQSTFPVTGAVYHFSVPREYLFDGILDLVVNSELGDFDFSDASLSVRVDRVPEPASILLLASGLIALGASRKRR